MKTKIIISLVAGILIGVLAHHAWLDRTSTARHWRAVKAYVAYMRDPSNATLDPQSRLPYMDPPLDDPEPHLAALVEADELRHLDIVLPTVPYSNRSATLHWMAFCERHPDDIVYAYGNPSSVAFPTKGEQPIHLNIWFRKSAEAVVQQLIRELEEMGTQEKPTTTSALSSEQNETVAPFDLPAGVVHETEDDIEFHSFRWGTNDITGLFMMSPHPAGLSREMVDKMASDAAPQVESAMREIEGVEGLSTETRDFTAGDFTGKAIICKLRMTDGKTVYQTMHILWDGTRFWQGQLTGTKEDDLTMVRTILKSKTKDLRTKTSGVRGDPRR